MNCNWFILSLSQWHVMSIAFIFLGWMMLFTTPFDVELSVWMGVGGWGCPISARMFLMYTASFALMNSTLLLLLMT